MRIPHCILSLLATMSLVICRGYSEEMIVYHLSLGVFPC